MASDSSPDVQSDDLQEALSVLAFLEAASQRRQVVEWEEWSSAQDSDDEPAPPTPFEYNALPVLYGEPAPPMTFEFFDFPDVSAALAAVLSKLDEES